MRTAVVGVAIGPRELAATCRGRGKTHRVWRTEFPELGPADAATTLRGALSAMKTALSLDGAELQVAVLPPLSSIRTLEFPGLRLAEIGQVVARNPERYFPVAARGHLTAVSGRAPRIAAALMPSWLADAITAAAEAHQLTIAYLGPAHQAVARSAGSAEVAWAMLHDRAREVVQVARGRVSLVRRMPAEGEQLGDLDPGTVAPLAAAGVSAEDELEFVGPAAADTRAKWLGAWNRRLWAAALAAAAAALLVYRTALVREAGAYREARLQQRTAVARAVELKNALEQLRLRLAPLAEADRQVVRWTAVLGHLAKAVPADGYLTGLKATPDSIALEGTARQAARVFQGLRGIPGFAEVRPSGPIRQEVVDSGVPMERFVAFARLLRGSPEAPP